MCNATASIRPCVFLIAGWIRGADALRVLGLKRGAWADIGALMSWVDRAWMAWLREVVEGEL